MPKPSTRHLSRPLAEAARAIAERVAGAGARAWVVGGAVRDLCLGNKVRDLDMCSALEPERLEELFEHTVPVGKAFGTVIVVVDDLPVEVTTFRSERGYSDGRRPDGVVYGATPEEDAERRDFTCNALFLDPLTDELLDPTGGVADLEAGVLRTVGDPAERFAEDALRLLRLARFHARYDLEVEPATLAAARDAAAGLARISRERVLDELAKLLTRRNAHGAVGLLAETGLLEAALPGLEALHGPHRSESVGDRLAALEWLESTDLAAGLAVLLDPLGGAREPALALLDGLKPSRELRRDVAAAWSLLDAMEALEPQEGPEAGHLPPPGPERAARLRVLRDPAWPRARDLAAAWGDDRALDPDLEGGHLGHVGRELAELGQGLSDERLHPAPLLGSADLRDAGVAPGPRYGELLAAAEDLQLQGLLSDRGAALAWLAEQAAG